MSLSRPPPRHPSEPVPHRPLTSNDPVSVYCGPSGWVPGFIVAVNTRDVRVLIDAPRRSRTFSDAFATGFDSDGLMWLDANSTRIRRRRLKGS